MTKFRFISKRIPSDCLLKCDGHSSPSSGSSFPLNRAEAIERALGPELAEFYRLREQTLSRLEQLTGKLVRETHEYRIQLDAETAKHKSKLATSFEEKHKKSNRCPGES